MLGLEATVRSLTPHAIRVLLAGTFRSALSSFSFPHGLPAIRAGADVVRSNVFFSAPRHVLENFTGQFNADAPCNGRPADAIGGRYDGFLPPAIAGSKPIFNMCLFIGRVVAAPWFAILGIIATIIYWLYVHSVSRRVSQTRGRGGARTVHSRTSGALFAVCVAISWPTVRAAGEIEAPPKSTGAEATEEAKVSRLLKCGDGTVYSGFGFAAALSLRSGRRRSSARFVRP